MPSFQGENLCGQAEQAKEVQADHEHRLLDGAGAGSRRGGEKIEGNLQDVLEQALTHLKFQKSLAGPTASVLEKKISAKLAK